MDDQIICPHCKKPIPLSQAFSHQMEEKMKNELDEEKRKMNFAAKKWREEQLKKINEERLKNEEELKEKLKEKINREMELKWKDAQNEREELAKDNKKLQEQLLEIIKQNREIKAQRDQEKLEIEKKRIEDEEKIREEAQKRADESYRLKIAEQDKKLQDAMKANDDLKRKLEQGSQQLQGEVLELIVEDLLKKEFPYDEIQPVAKGARGGDVIQTVRNNTGRVCGSIIWESKRTKAWSNEWITKLKDDQRQVKAELAVLISQVLPKDIKRFGWVEKICVCDYETVIAIATMLRSQLLEIALVKSSLDGRKDKMTVLYHYLTGTEFRQRVEAILEAYSTLQDDMEKEKRWFAAKWARQEKNIRKVIDNTLGMQGELQSIMGKSFKEIPEVEKLPEKIVDKSDTLF